MQTEASDGVRFARFRSQQLSQTEIYSDARGTPTWRNIILIFIMTEIAKVFRDILALCAPRGCRMRKNRGRGLYDRHARHTYSSSRQRYNSYNNINRMLALYFHCVAKHDDSWVHHCVSKIHRMYTYVETASKISSYIRLPYIIFSFLSFFFFNITTVPVILASSCRERGKHGEKFLHTREYLIF